MRGIQFIFVSLVWFGLGGANVASQMSQPALVRNVTEFLTAVPPSVLPQDRAGWTDAKVTLVNAHLAGQLGRLAEWEVEVAEVRREANMLLLIGRGTGAEPYSIGAPWCFIAADNESEVGRFNVGDRVTLVGRVAACEFRKNANGVWFQLVLRQSRIKGNDGLRGVSSDGLSDITLPAGCVGVVNAVVDAPVPAEYAVVLASDQQLGRASWVVLVPDPTDRWTNNNDAAVYDYMGIGGGRMQVNYEVRGGTGARGVIDSPAVLVPVVRNAPGREVALWCRDDGEFVDNRGAIRVRGFLFADTQVAQAFTDRLKDQLRRSAEPEPAPSPAPSRSAPTTTAAADAPFVESAPSLPADTPATAFARRRGSISGLVVQDTSAGFVGSRMEVLAVVAPHGGDGYARLVKSVGPQMTTAFEEALRTVRVDHPRWAPGEVQVSFSDKYTPKDGGSAGAAFAVLVSSLLEGFEIDPAFAMTGDITVDGKVRAVGGLGAKIRGAARDGAILVAVPMENAQAVTDFVVLEGVEGVLGAQVVGVGTLAEAAGLARADRTGPTAEAVALFAGLKLMTAPGSGSQGMASGSWRPSAEHVAVLEKVLELCPSHLSADLALKHAKNQLPRTLGAASSINEAFVAIRPVWPDELEEKLRQKTLDRSVVASVKARLRKVQLLSHPGARGLVEAVAAYVNQVELAARRGSLSDETAQKINKTLRDVARESQSIGADRELVEEILR